MKFAEDAIPRSEPSQKKKNELRQARIISSRQTYHGHQLSGQANEKVWNALQHLGNPPGCHIDSLPVVFG
jgi:hypothetical protein